MARRLNILFLMADQLAATFLPAYGNRAVKSPNIDALAAKAAVFDSCYCASPLCAPSRFTMMAGAAVSRIGAYDNAAEFSAGTPTFAHYLRAAGYRTALAGKMHFCGPDQLHGFEERLTTDIYPADFGWTPDWEHPEIRPSWYHNMGSVTESGTCVRSNQLDFDDEVTYAARRHIFDLARSGDGRPFCLAVSWTHPHDPYANLPELFDLYRDDEIPMPSVTAGDVPLDPHTARLRHVSDMDNYQIGETDIRRARRAYLASISYIDRQVGTVLQALRESGLEDDTIVILTADHGDMLGERGLWYKMTWFENACRIPLIVSAPGKFAARHIAGSASHLDLLPTLAEIAADGKGFTPAAAIDGQSLLGALSGGTGPDEAIGEYCGEGAIAPLVMIRRAQWKFVHTPSDPDQLYDLASDPLEKQNLAADPAAAETVAAFRAEVKRRWNLERLKEQVIDSQRRRHAVYAALGQGRHRSWDYQPIRDAGTAYMRNNVVLDDLEARTRLPRVS
jgi:choline-sulfatase